MYILFDIGSTRMRIASSKTGGSLDNIIIERTPTSYIDALATIRQAIDRLALNQKLEAICGGITGILNTKTGIIRKISALPDWECKALAQDMTRIMGAKTYIFNDADLATYAEAISGAGVGYDSIVGLMLSTQVGGGHIRQKQLAQNNSHFEPGSMIVGTNGQTLQDLVSVTSLYHKYKIAPEYIQTPEVWDEIHDILARATANISTVCSPDVIILGGGISNKLDPEDLQRRTASYVHHLSVPEFVYSELGEYATLHGALHFINSKY